MFSIPKLFPRRRVAVFLALVILAVISRLTYGPRHEVGDTNPEHVMQVAKSMGIHALPDGYAAASTSEQSISLSHDRPAFSIRLQSGPDAVSGAKAASSRDGGGPCVFSHNERVAGKTVKICSLERTSGSGGRYAAPRRHVHTDLVFLTSAAGPMYVDAVWSVDQTAEAEPFLRAFLEQILRKSPELRNNS